MSNNEWHRTIDLGAVGSELERRGTHTPLWKAIKRFHSAGSVSRDLEAVRGSLTVFFDPVLHAETETWAAIGRGLLVHAVIAYCRATYSSSNTRWEVGVQKAYSEEQKLKHKKIGRLRDTTFAHFESSGEGVGEGWYQDRALLEIWPGRSRLSHMRTGWGYRWDVGTALKELVDTALPYVYGRLPNLEQGLRTVLDEQVRSDPDFRDLLRRHFIDPSTLHVGPPPNFDLSAMDGNVTWSGFSSAD